MQKNLSTWVILFCIIVGAAPAAHADAFKEIYDAALTAQLAPACGVRSASWAAQVELGSEAAVQAELPNTGMFPSRDQLNTIKDDETVVDGAVADGKYLFEDYGKQSCKEFLTTSALQDADTIATNAPLSGQLGGWTSPQETQAAWAASRADIAFACKFRTDTWLQTATVANFKDLLNAAYISSQPLDDQEKEAAINAANKLLNFDKDIAIKELAEFRPQACKAIKNSVELAIDDASVKNWEAQKDPWAGAGGN